MFNVRPAVAAPSTCHFQPTKHALAVGPSLHPPNPTSHTMSSSRVVARLAFLDAAAMVLASVTSCDVMRPWNAPLGRAPAVKDLALEATFRVEVVEVVEREEGGPCGVVGAKQTAQEDSVEDQSSVKCTSMAQEGCVRELLPWFG